MSDQQIRNDIFNVVWKACDTFRGTIDPSTYKDYILTMLFVKYLSDVRKSKLAEYGEQYNGDVVRIERAMRHERFSIDADCTFDFLFAKREDSDIGQLINTVLEKIEDANKAKLHNVFRNIDFNSEANLGKARQRNERLKNLLEGFNEPKLDMRRERVCHVDIIGDVYEYLIARFASQAGKRRASFTPRPKSPKRWHGWWPRKRATASAIRPADRDRC
jgi:type I restriction enzyme M protein